MKKLSIGAFLGTAITVAILSPGLTTAVEAKSRIVVVDNDCMNVPDGFGSGVSSGDTIILDTNLTLDGDGGDCILISNVQRVNLMLNGHSIDLNSSGIAGVRVENSTSVKIIGPGKINGFALGATVANSSKVLVSRLIVRGRGTGTGIALESTSSSQVKRNIVFNFLEGVLVNSVFGSPVSTDNTVSRNEVFANDQGIRILDGNNTGTGNNVSSNASTGITVGGDEPNTIVDNIVLGNGAWDIRRLSGEQVGTVIENNVCEISEPIGHCPALIPDFDIDHF